MRDGKWKAGEASYKRLGPDRRRVIVYWPSKRSRVVSACERAIRSWNWTVTVAVAFMIALVVTTAVGSAGAGSATSSGLTSHYALGRDVSLAATASRADHHRPSI
jgi:hypothetical protein